MYDVDNASGSSTIPKIRLLGFEAPQGFEFSLNYLRTSQLSATDQETFNKEFKELYEFTVDSTGAKVYNNNYASLYQQTLKLRQQLQNGSVTYDDLLQRLSADLLHKFIDVTQFVTSCTWSELTNPPYSNGAITLRIPEFLTTLILHGRVSSYAINPKEDNFDNQAKTFGKAPRRDISAGGWLSISRKDDVPLFFGKIVTINVVKTVEENGRILQEVIFTLASAIYPLMVSSFILSTNDKLVQSGIDGGAISLTHATTGLDVNAAPRTNISNPLATLTADIEKKTAPQALEAFIKYFAYHEIPINTLQSVLRILIEAKGELDGTGKLADILLVNDGSLSDAYEKQVSKKLDSLDNIKILPSGYVGVYRNTEVKSVWNLIRQVFQVDPDLIELFPTLLRYTEKTVEGSTIATSPITQPRYAIIYRFKPMQPDFDGSDYAINRKFPYSLRVRDTNMYAVYGLRDDVQGVKRDATRERYEADWYLIDPKKIISQNLTWDDTSHSNFVEVKPTTNESQTASPLTIPAYNTRDINRNGLRPDTRLLPFYWNPSSSTGSPAAGSDPSRLAAALAERLYFQVAESNTFASGTLTCTYISDINLTCGLWIKVSPTVGDGQPPLTGYLEEVKHDISVDSAGAAVGTTILRLTRVSYGGKVPYLSYLKTVVTPPSTVDSPHNPARVEVRPPNNPVAPAPVPQQTEAAPRATATTDPTQPAAQDPQAPQAFTKGGTSATATQRATGKDPARRRKTVSKQAPKVPTPADPKVPGGTAKSRTSRTTARPKITPSQQTSPIVYNGDLPQKPIYSAFLHYDDPTVPPLAVSIEQLQIAYGERLNIEVSESGVVTIDFPALFMPQDSDFYTAYAYKVLDYRAAERDGGSFYRIEYEDGAVGIVYVIFGANGDVVETRRFAFARGPLRGQVTRATPTDLPDQTTLDFDISLPQSEHPTPFNE